MIEYTVKHDFYPVFMQGLADPCKALVISETVVYIKIIISIISVCCRAEHGAKIYCIDVHFLKMRNEVEHLVKTILELTVVDPWSPCKAEGINVIKNRFVDPIHISFPFKEAFIAVYSDDLSSIAQAHI